MTEILQNPNKLTMLLVMVALGIVGVAFLAIMWIRDAKLARKCVRRMKMENEKRLIDVDKVINAMQKCLDESPDKKDSVAYFAFESIITALKQEPTVDAVEVVHGRWKYYHKQNIAVCTNCSFERDLDANFGKAVSCPNCGAKMDGDGNG